MKNILTDLVILTVQVVLLVIALFAGLYAISLLIQGIEFLPQYIGGFGTFMLYVAGFLLLLSVVLYLNKK